MFIVTSVGSHWEIVELKTRRKHYARTTREWLHRLERHEATIRSRWGDQVFDDHQRYLRTCVTCFDQGYQSLAQFILRRLP